jgi:hypothetical protein
MRCQVRKMQRWRKKSQRRSNGLIRIRRAKIATMKAMKMIATKRPLRRKRRKERRRRPRRRRRKPRKKRAAVKMKKRKMMRSKKRKKKRRKSRYRVLCK